MSEHFSNNGKINDLTVEGDTAKERSREIKEVSPHSGCSQSIKPSIYTDWVDDANNPLLKFLKGRKKN